MDSLMLLGGQFLQARMPYEGESGRVPPAARSREFWEGLDSIERGVRDVYGLAQRLAAAFIVLAIVLSGLAAAAPAEAGAGQVACLACAPSPNDQGQPSFTPFRLAIWSESIGR